MVDGTKPSRSPFRAIPIGAACGGLLFVIAGLVCAGLAAVTGERSFLRDFFRNFVLYPGVVGGLAGSAVGCTVWVTHMRRHIPMPLLVFSWSLSGGVVAFFLTVAAFLTHAYFEPRSKGMNAAAAIGAGYELLAGLCFASLMFGVGAIIGAIIGGVVGVRARTRALAEPLKEERKGSRNG